MREIVFDTETTGFDPAAGDKVVEIGCVELLNGLPTGEHFHKYINPERDMPDAAFQVHGLSEEFLKTHPVFAEIVEEFLAFIGDARLVAHNADFDMKFINAELKNLGFKPIPASRSVDTLAIARQKFPGSPNTLDALCKRFNVDNSGRTKHGALLDSELLAEVYLELLGGRQVGLALVSDSDRRDQNNISGPERIYRAPRPHSPSEEELAAHEAFIAKIEDALWTR